jgi:hypothetical protein
MTRIIALKGSACFNLATVRSVAREFGWEVETANGLSPAIAALRDGSLAAVLFHRDAFGSCSWAEATRLLSSALPKVCLIPCHDFSEPIDWPELCDAGAFHSLWLPLKESEVRQSFGFINEAQHRLTRPAEKAMTAAGIPHEPFHGNVVVSAAA